MTVHAVGAHDETIAAADVEHPHRERLPRLAVAEEARQRGEPPACIRDVVGAEPGELELGRHGVVTRDRLAGAVAEAVHADVAGVGDNRAGSPRVHTTRPPPRRAS